MSRIEKQRDEAEEERVKDVMRRMAEECEEALRRQWADAEARRLQSLRDMREQMRREILEEMREEMERAIRAALDKAEVVLTSPSTPLLYSDCTWRFSNLRHLYWIFIFLVLFI